MTAVLNFPLNILLQIFSYLEVDDLIELYETCEFFRILIRDSRLSTEIRTVGINDTKNLNLFWSTDEFKKNNTNSVGSSVLTYIKIIERINNTITMQEEERLLKEKTEKLDESTILGNLGISPESPTLSSSSRLSGNSLFSDDEWNFSLDESMSTPTTIQHKEPSTESMDKLRGSKKVKDKALLFERLMLKEADNVPTYKKTAQQVKNYDALYDKFSELQNLILPTSNNKRNISDTYLMQIQETSNSKSPNVSTNAQNKLGSSKLLSKYQQHLGILNGSHDNQTMDKNNLNEHGRNKLKVVLSNENKIVYEKI